MGAVLSLWQGIQVFQLEVDVAEEGMGSLMERRATARAPVDGRVEMRFDVSSNHVMHYVTNVSAGGMFIRTPDVRPPGTLLEFRLALTGGGAPIEGRAEVVWARNLDQFQEGPPGMAVRFLDMDQADLLEIALLVRQQLSRGEEIPTLNEPPIPLSVDAVPEGEPFEVDSLSGEEGPAVAFDVFPFRDDVEPEGPQDAAPFPGAGIADDAAAIPAPPARSSSGLLMVLVAVVVLALAAYAYLASGRRNGGDGVAPAAPGTAAKVAPPSGVDQGEAPGRTVTRAAAKAVAIESRPAPEGGESPSSGRETKSVTPAGPSPPEETPLPGSTGSAHPAKRVDRPGAVGARPPGAELHRTARSASPAKKLGKIHVGGENGGTRVVLDFDGVVSGSRIRSFRMDNPPRYVVQLRGIGAEDPFAILSVGTPEVEKVRLGLHSERRPAYLQVVLDLQSGRDRVTRKLTGRSLIIHVNRTGH